MIYTTCFWIPLYRSFVFNVKKSINRCWWHRTRGGGMITNCCIHLHLDILPAAPAGQAAKAGRVFRPVSAHHEGCRGPAAVAYHRTAVILHSIATPRFSLSIPRLLFNSTPFYDHRLSFYLAGEWQIELETSSSTKEDLEFLCNILYFISSYFGF